MIKEEVIQRLGANEPNYRQLAAMSAGAGPHIVALINGDDVELAAKATYLASVIETHETHEALASAAASPHDIVRPMRRASDTSAQ